MLNILKTAKTDPTQQTNTGSTSGISLPPAAGTPDNGVGKVFEETVGTRGFTISNPSWGVFVPMEYLRDRPDFVQTLRSAAQYGDNVFVAGQHDGRARFKPSRLGREIHGQAPTTPAWPAGA